jgi:hypothetical protein
MPRALYPKKSVVVTRTHTIPTDLQMKAHLLCPKCEARFSENGESEVLRWLAPKSRKRFPLLDRIKIAIPRHIGPSFVGFSGFDIGVDSDKFAYFVLSILWRSAVHRWPKPDGTITSPIDLHAHEEPIRTFLVGQGPFPSDITVVVTVCTDRLSREIFYTPSEVSGNPHKSYGLAARGVYFRALMGADVPLEMRQICCSSSMKWIFARNCEGKILEAYAGLKGIDFASADSA